MKPRSGSKCIFKPFLSWILPWIGMASYYNLRRTLLILYGLGIDMLFRSGDLLQVGGFLMVPCFPPPIKLTATRYSWNIVESGVKHHNSNSVFHTLHIIMLFWNFDLQKIQTNYNTPYYRTSSEQTVTASIELNTWCWC
jgi:hypothetical protein